MIVMKTWIKRAARTFVQTFAGTVGTGLVAAVSGASDLGAMKVALLGLLASAVSAGIAAVMNFHEE